MNYFLVFLGLFFSFSVALSSDLITKRILLMVYPGGKSHNFVVKQLFDYSKSHQTEFKYEYHIIVHNIDKSTWMGATHEQGYYVYGFGDEVIYHDMFQQAIEQVRSNPMFGHFNFNKAMIYMYDEFIHSSVIQDLSKFHFDAISTDVPNFITIYLRKIFNIPIHFYLTPPSMPQFFYYLFEMNPSYVPALGSVNSDEMTFFERVLNSIYVLGTKMTFNLFQYQQSAVFERNGLPLNTTSILVYDSFVMLQYPKGFLFPLVLPPNFLLLNAITPKKARSLSESEPVIDKFLSKYKKNIYCSQGTIVQIMNLKQLIEMFSQFEQESVGFILSFPLNLVDKEILDKLPSNVLITDWVQQNDLLGDKRIHGFITHGGTNSVYESVYHNKPMIVIGVTLDQRNTAATVKKRKVGIVFQSVEEVSITKLISSIKELLLDDNVYKKNAIKYGDIMKGNKPAEEEYLYWLNFGLKYGYESLFVNLYQTGYFWQVYNYDIMLLFFSLLALFAYLSFKILCRLCRTKEKTKTE